MVNILTIKDDVIKVLFYINLIFLAVAIFFSQKWIFILCVCINIILDGTFMVISKYGKMFMPQVGLSKKLDDSLNFFLKLGNQDGKV